MLRHETAAAGKPRRGGSAGGGEKSLPPLPPAAKPPVPPPPPPQQNIMYGFIFIILVLATLFTCDIGRYHIFLLPGGSTMHDEMGDRHRTKNNHHDNDIISHT